MRKLGKRGVSPVIATILLISFAIALGAVVMNWGRNYVEVNTEDNSHFSFEYQCSNIEINVAKMNNKLVCFDSTDVQFFLENNGREIYEVQVTIFGDSQVINPVGDQSPIPAGSTMLVKAPHNSIPSINKVKIIPKLMINGEEYPCTSSSFETTEISTC